MGRNRVRLLQGWVGTGTGRQRNRWRNRQVDTEWVETGTSRHRDGWKQGQVDMDGWAQG